MNVNEYGEIVDSYGRTEKQIYDDMEKDFSLPKDFGTYFDEEDPLQQEFFFIEDDANELLANIGLEQKLDLSNYPREQLRRLFRYYHLKSEKDVNGKKEYVDPLPDYRAGNESYEKEMFKFGYNLGKIGTIGIYYRMLPNFQFRRGYWVGKMERYVEQNDDNILRELSKEIKVYDALKADEEMGYIVNNIFVEEEPVVTHKR